MTSPRRAVVSWSGGKDSSLALHAALHDPTLHIEALVTTVTSEYDRISMHGVRRALLEAQAEAIGIPLIVAPIPPRSTNAQYEAAMAEALAPLCASGVTHMVCGDLYLTDIREYRERLLAPLGITAVFPVWLRDTAQLAREFIALGFEATLCCVDPKQIDPSFCGRRFDDSLLADLPALADPCGENGEFHTFVSNGPIFRRPVGVRVGERVERDGFWFCDLVPAESEQLAPTP